MAVLERADPRGVALRPVHARLQRRGEQIDVLRPRRARTERDEQTAPAVDEAGQPPTERGGHDNVVEDHDRGSLKIVVRQGLRLPHGRLEARRVADGQCLREIQRGTARAAAIDDHHADGLGGRDDEIKDVVRGEGVGAGTHAAAHVARGERERRKGDRGRAAGLHVETLRLNRLAVELEDELSTRERLGTAVGHDRGGCHSLLIRETWNERARRR